MAERIVEKLEILNEQAKIFLARRIKKSSVRSYIKKTVRPLTFDFQLESKEDITDTSTSVTVSQSREDTPHSITKTESHDSLKNEPEPRKSDFEKLNLSSQAAPTNIKNQENKSIEPVEENKKPRCNKSFFYLKDLREVDYAKPLQYLFSHHKYRQEHKGKLDSISSTIPSIQSDASKKEKVATSFKAQTGKRPKEPFDADAVVYLKDYAYKRGKNSLQLSDLCSKEKKSVRFDPLSEYHSEGKKSLLPLCFEDILKKPNTKMISVSPPKIIITHKEQNDTNLVNFYETRHIHMFLLTKNRFLLESRISEPQNRVKFVLERNRENLKPLIYNQCITSSKPKRTMPTAWRKRMQVRSFAVGSKVIEDKLKKKSTTKTSKNISKKSYNFRGKPKNKSNASPVKCSKPLKNKLQVHILQTVTPLDDLLTLSSED